MEKYDIVMPAHEMHLFKCLTKTRRDVKPCPFCGERTEIWAAWYNSAAGQRFAVMCVGCLATVDRGHAQTEWAALDHWNARCDADGIESFVNSLLLHGAEIEMITADEAQQAMENWVRDGVELPAGMTAQRYMDAWNELVRLHYRKRFETIDKIVSRAEEMGIGVFDRITQMMDIQNADKQFNLRLDEFLAAEPMDFAHDYCGIQREINRNTCRIEGFFVPRFAEV